MKTLAFITLSLLVFTTQLSEPTPPVVETYYESMKRLASNIDGKSASELELQMKACFFLGRGSGINLPNDFRFFEYDKSSISHKNSTLTSNNYVNKLAEFLYKERVLTVDYRILKSEPHGAVPDFQSSRLSSTTNLVSTYVEKTYTLNGRTHAFNDTLITDITVGKISRISNGGGVLADDPHTLRIKAAHAYQRGLYAEAYKYYERIIALDKKDGDSFYRIGLMTYWRQGCEHKFAKKKDARNKAKEYMLMAEIRGSYKIRKQAENVMHYWEYPNQ